MKLTQSIKNVVVTVIFMSCSLFLFAQKSGVFKSYTDYTIGKMQYGIDCSTEKHIIKLNNFWSKDHITVIHDGKPYNLKKAEILGFQLCDEKVVPFRAMKITPLVIKVSCGFTAYDLPYPAILKPVVQKPLPFIILV